MGRKKQLWGNQDLLTIVLFVLAIVWTVFIWSNSAKPATESSGQSLFVLAQVKDILLSLGFQNEILHTLVRKAAHIVEFMLLGVLWTALSERLWSEDRKFAILLPLFLCMVTALIDETIQLNFEGRAGMVQDIWVDLVGVVFGVVVSELILNLRNSR